MRSPSPSSSRGIQRRQAVNILKIFQNTLRRFCNKKPSPPDTTSEPAVLYKAAHSSAIYQHYETITDRTMMPHTIFPNHRLQASSGLPLLAANRALFFFCQGKILMRTRLMRGGSSDLVWPGLNHMLLALKRWRDDLDALRSGWPEIAMLRDTWREMGETFAQQWDQIGETTPRRRLIKFLN